MFSQPISSRCRTSIRSLCSWDRRSETRRSATSSSRRLSRRSNPFGAADRSCCFSRAFSSRSNAIVRPSADSETSVRSRATSACKESALLAARRTSFVSSTAAFSLVRLLSSCHFREPAWARESTSAQRSSSQRASAASARARSCSAWACACSYNDCQSRGSSTGADMAGDQLPPSASVTVSAEPKSSSRIAMHTTINNRRRCYQRVVHNLQIDFAQPITRQPKDYAVARGASVRSRGEGRDESAGAGASLHC